MSTDAAFKALAEPHRRAILRLVRDQPCSVTEIAEHFDITQQAVSLHLKVLREAGLVGVRRDGQRRLYLVDPEGMDSLQDFLAELWPAGLDRLKHAVESGRSTRQEPAREEPAHDQSTDQPTAPAEPGRPQPALQPSPQQYAPRPVHP